MQKEDEETHNNEDYKSLYTENTKYKTKHTRTSLRSRPDEDLNEKIVTAGEAVSILQPSLIARFCVRNGLGVVWWCTLSPVRYPILAKAEPRLGKKDEIASQRISHDFLELPRQLAMTGVVLFFI